MRLGRKEFAVGRLGRIRPDFGLLHGIRIRQQLVHREVRALDEHPGGGRLPFGKDDRLRRVMPLRVHPHHRQRIAADDVPAQDERGRLQHIVLHRLPADGAIRRFPLAIEPLAAALHVVREDVHAVEKTQHEKRATLEFKRRTAAFRPNGRQLAAQDLDEEIAVAARRFEERAGVVPGLRLHEIEHGVHLARGRVDLAVGAYPLTRHNLFALFRQRSVSLPPTRKERNTPAAKIARASFEISPTRHGQVAHPRNIKNGHAERAY